MMATENLRKRVHEEVPRAPDVGFDPSPQASAGGASKSRSEATEADRKKAAAAQKQLLQGDAHPGGAIKHGSAKQYFRMFLFAAYFVLSCVSMHFTQYLGVPFYFYNQDWYYAWMSMTKQHFGLLVVTMQQWWSPTLIRVSGDRSVRGQLRKTEDGRLESDFPERIVLIANHQLYTDWLYLWWMAYTARMHGHIFIILKESLKYIPILGQGMQFFSFIFLSRKWETDKPRFQHRLRKLKTAHHGPLSGTQELDPMWLLIFPEGTNMSKGGRASSAKWSEKTGLPDLEHVLLPRTTGLLFCLQELKGTVDWIYDCTVAYEGTPRGQYGQDIFTLSSTYFQGRPPKSVNMHWRRFAMANVPLDDEDAFKIWLVERWVEKNALLEHYMQHGQFPLDVDSGDVPFLNGHAEKTTSTSTSTIEQPQQESGGDAGYIETEVKPRSPFEFLQIFAPWVAMFLLFRLVRRMWQFVVREGLGLWKV